MSFGAFMLSQIRFWAIAGLVTFVLVYWFARKTKQPDAAQTAFGCGCMVILALSGMLVLRIVSQMFE
jgi:hypothetical protein